MAQRRMARHVPNSIDIDVDITDFGPLSRGKFKIKPLTILIGPNNSGKTYAAMLVHSMLSAHRRSATYWFRNEFVKRRVLDPEFKSLAREMARLLSKEPNGDGHITIPSRFVNKIHKMIFQNIDEHFQQTLSQNFGSQLHELVRTGANVSKLKVSSNNQITSTISKKVNARYRCAQHKYLVMNHSTKLYMVPLHMTDPKFSDFVSTMNKTINEITDQLSRDLPLDAADGTMALLTLLIHILYISDEYLPFNSHYFPAARSGIMHAYKPIVSGSVQSRIFHNNKKPFSGTSGVLADFLTSIINTNPNRASKFHAMGESAESKLFEGKIILTHPDIGIPEIYYRFMKKDIPIHIASSSIAEISPLTLFLRFNLQKGDMLIIEEPEAHLHPANQIILAKYLAQLIRRGVKIMITTHSVFYLEQLSLLVKLGGLTPEQRKKMGYKPDVYLLDTEVAPFAFQKNSMGDYTIKEIPHSAKIGISQEEFVNLDADTHNVDLNIDRMIKNNEMVS